MNKHELFNKELETITNEDIRDFAKKLLDDAPEYFFHVAASSTGKYHPQISLGDGGLMRHTKAVIRFFNHIMGVEQNSSLFTDRELDLGRVACLIHDIQKSGDATTYAEKSNNGEKKVFTVFDHPLLAAKYVLAYKGQYLNEEELEYIASAVRGHMGQWNTDKRSSVVLPKPETEMQKMVHLADYLASRKDIEMQFDASEKEQLPSIDEYVIPFGKHKGKTLSQINKEDPGWITWAKENFEREPVKSLLKQM